MKEQRMQSNQTHRNPPKKKGFGDDDYNTVTCNDFTSKNRDLWRRMGATRIVERDDEPVIAEPELRHGVPLAGDVLRR